MEHKTYTLEDYRAFQNIPCPDFRDDLRSMLRTAFGSDWNDHPPGQAAIDKLHTYSFLPEAFLALYEIAGGEDRLWRQGFLPVDQMELDQRLWGPKDNQRVFTYLVYQRIKKEEYAFCDSVPPIISSEPFHGIYHRSPNSFRRDWGRWCSWGGWGASRDRVTIATALLRQVGEALAREMPHCVWAQTPLKKEGKLSRCETLAKRFGCTVLQSMQPLDWDFACDPDRGILMQYCDQTRTKVLIYSRNAADLQALESICPIVWKRRDGKTVLYPEKFIQSPAPVTFAEKLEEMSRVLLGKRSLALPPEEIEKAEDRLGITFPEALREFYLRFGKGGKLLTSDSLEDIFTPKQLTVQDGRLLLAEENQGVWRIYLDAATGEHYMDWGNGREDGWGLSLPDTLLYLLSMNALGFLPQGGSCTLEDTPENRELLGRCFHFLSDGKMAVFTNPERNLAGCRCGEDQIYIKAHSEKALNQLEEDFGLLVSAF